MREAARVGPGGVVRTAAFYVTIYMGTGVSLPFISLWFRAHGLSGAEIGTVLALPMLARVVSGPLIAVWADSFKLRRTALAVLAAIGACGYLALALGRELAVWAPAWLVANTALSAMIPLADVLVMRRARKEGFAFGAARGVGSAAFIVANVAMGALLAARGVDVIVIWITAVASLSALAAVLVLPREPVHEDGPVSRADRFRGLGRLFGDRDFMTAIVSTGLIQAAHAFYYGFSTLVWKGQGVSTQTSGALWAAAVASEVLFLWFSEPLRRRIGPFGLIALGGVGAVVRWTAFAFSPTLELLWPLQLLHGLTFAATYLGGLQLVERLSSRQSVSAAQTLSSVISSGVLIGLATQFSGPLYDRYGAMGYLAMAVMALLGLAGAFSLRRRLSAA